MSLLGRCRVVGGLLTVASAAAVLAGPTLAASSAGSSPDRAATAVTPARGVTYGGSTSSKDPIMITLSRDGSRVVQLSTQLRAKCVSGAHDSFLVGPPANHAIRGGGFRGTRVRTFPVVNKIYSAVQTVTVSGKVKGLQLFGSVKVHSELTDAAHAVIDTCDRTVTFKVVASEGRVFAGMTSQGRPIVLELTADGASVRHFHIGWRASCRPSGIGFSWGDTLIAFPISRGRFGDAFTRRFSMPNGGTALESYALGGGFSGPRIGGTFRWRSTEMDATGATTDTCDTGRVAFRTSSG
jgi:hypothetical protein